MRGVGGTAFLLDLGEATVLDDGDVLALEDGRPITREEIRRDITRLFRSNFEHFAGSGRSVGATP